MQRQRKPTSRDHAAYEVNQMSKPTPNATALNPDPSLSSLVLLFPISAIRCAASILLCVGDGGPLTLTSSALRLASGPRSSPNEILVIESSLNPRIGLPGLVGTTATGTGTAFVAGGLSRLAGRLDFDLGKL